MEAMPSFLMKMEDLVRQVVGFYNVSCYRIDALIETHQATDGGKVRVPVIRIVGFFEDTIAKLTPILNAEFELSVIKENKAQTNEMFSSAAKAFLVGLKPNRLSLPEYKVFANEKVEIRVSSILQDVYASMHRELSKGKAAIPTGVVRDFYRVGALIEMADIEFVRIKSQVTASSNGISNATDAAVNIPEITRGTQVPVGSNIIEETPTVPSAINTPIADQIKITTSGIDNANIESFDMNVDSFNSLGVSIGNIENKNGVDNISYLDLLKPLPVVEPLNNNVANNVPVTETPVASAPATALESVALNIDNIETFNMNVSGMIERTTEIIREGGNDNTSAPKAADEARLNAAMEEGSQMTEASLKDFVSNSPIVKEVDRMIADRAGAKINDEIDIEGDVERLRFLKVFTLKQLQEKILDNKDEIVAFAEKWIGKDNGGSFDSGICLFYLEYLLVGKKNDPAFAVEYVLKFISDNDYSARYIIPTYNSIRQTAEPSSFAHLTLK